jgi:hypothetical protein
VLLVQAQIEALPVAEAGADVRDLVDGHRLAAGGSTGQHRHQCEQRDRTDDGQPVRDTVVIFVPSR